MGPPWLSGFELGSILNHAIFEKHAVCFQMIERIVPAAQVLEFMNYYGKNCKTLICKIELSEP